MDTKAQQGTYAATVSKRAAGGGAAGRGVGVDAIIIIIAKQLTAAVVDARLASGQGVAVGTGGSRGERSNGENEGGDDLHLVRIVVGFVSVCCGLFLGGFGEMSAGRL